MKTDSNSFRTFLGCLALTFVFSTGHGYAIDWASTREEAVARATSSGKLILLLAGRETCGNCRYMKYTVCESATVLPVLDGGYVCWFCPVDTSTEWYSYAGGLGTISLPLICVIDPGEPLAYLDRTTGTFPEAEFQVRVRSHLPEHPLRIQIVKDGPGRELHFETVPGFSYRIMAARSGDCRRLSRFHDRNRNPGSGSRLP
jgi:hypothetical protein